MKILSVASEVFPLIKTGGLADVAGALPLALAAHAIRTRTLLPGYRSVLAKLGRTEKVVHIADLFGATADILYADHDGLEVYILDCPALYDRDGGPYVDAGGKDFTDNWKRFAALSFVGADIAAGLIPDWRPDLVHVHDWQAALAPLYMKYGPAHATPSVLTIHNLAFQGQFGADVFAELRLPQAAFSVDGLEYYGDVGFLKGGLQSAWALTTVSPTYASEILTPEFGMGLEGLIRNRMADLSGIVNGIDDVVWNPQTDPHIATNYTAATLNKRSPNRAALNAHFGLEDDDGPVFIVITRLTWQKGMDMLVELIDDIVESGGKLAILGSGDQGLEGAVLAAASRHRGRVGVTIGYNEPLSHLMQAGADAILIPSRFEPCGLTQLYALRYGCVPVVARTGGLADTVIDANGAAVLAEVATGVQFSPISTDGFRQAIGRTFRLYANARLWRKMQKQGMKSDVSWRVSAAEYARLYQSLTNKHS
jgi:starch synthase